MNKDIDNIGPPGGPGIAAADWLGPWESSPIPVYCRDTDGVIVGANSAFEFKFGREGDTLAGTPAETLVHPEERAAFHAAIARPGRAQPESMRTHRWQTSKGWRWFVWEESPVLDDAGRQIATRAMCRDITRQKLAEELYLKLSRAVDQCHVAIAITDAEGRVQYVNPKFTTSTGYSLEDILDLKVELLREGHQTEEDYRRFWAAIRAAGEWRGELHRERPDGAMVWESVHVSSMRNPAGEITNLLCMREDITDRRRLQDELRQAQKMDSLGTLAGGIAHDFNNLLAVVTGYAGIASMNTGDTAILQKSLGEIIRAAQRASGLVSQILTFSRKAEVHFAPMDLNQLVGDLVALLSETFPRVIEFRTDLQAGLPPLMADQNQLQQVLLNLCVNARDAMPTGGVISVRTLHREKGSVTGPRADPTQSYASLIVTDTGVGMPPEVCSRIFEPFFTTKDVNKGTGLGLSVVYGIVASHHGFIEVESTPGAGSAFNIYLPMAESAPVPQAPAVSRDFPAGAEAILVVDDETALRELLRMALTRKGYRVTGARDGLEAIETIARADCELDAILLDLNMPGATGLDVLKVIRAMRPNLKVMVMSGNFKPDIREEIETLGVTSIVEKPYTLDEMGKRLRQLLDS